MQIPIYRTNLPFRGGVAEGDGGVVEHGLTPQSASLTAPLQGSYWRDKLEYDYITF